MIEIKDLLSRFNDILLTEEGKKETIRRVISDIIKVKINKEDMTLKNNIIYLNIKSIYKSEIFLKQEEIFIRLQSSLGEKSPKNIK